MESDGCLWASLLGTNSVRSTTRMIQLIRSISECYQYTRFIQEIKPARLG
jgi:hypothetical protein